MLFACKKLERQNGENLCCGCHLHLTWSGLLHLCLSLIEKFSLVWILIYKHE